VSVSAKFEKDTVDRRVERLQLEGLDEHRRVHSPEEKLDRRIVLVAGKKNEPPSSSRPDPRHRPVEHFAPDLRHQHVANDEIKGTVHDLAQALDTAPDGGHLIRAEGQVVVENLPEIITIFQEQNSPSRPTERRHFLVNVESDDLHGIGSSWSESHAPKPISKTGAFGTERDALSPRLSTAALQLIVEPNRRRRCLSDELCRRFNPAKFVLVARMINCNPLSTLTA
jgi:hypothetical protein